jgi:glycosyltransferase involved in cell wall biosynthesis
MSTPDISIIVPTFNRAQLLPKALNTCLAQCHQNIEIIISDNCSTDATFDAVEPFLKDPRVKYYRNASNLGMMGNWKKCIYERCNAKWFLLMSDDDYFTDPDYLSLAWDAISMHKPKLVYAGGRIVDIISGNTTNLDLPFSGLVRGIDVFKSRGTVRPQDFILSNVVFNRQAVMDFNFPRNPFNLSSDSELFLTLCLEGNVYAVPRRVMDYTLHGENFVSKISRVKELYTNNNDHLIYPYLHAIRKNIHPNNLNEFKKNSNLRNVIVNTLINLKLVNPIWHQEYRDQLKKNIPQYLDEIESSFYFYKKKIKAFLLQRIYRKKIHLTEIKQGDF